MLIVKDILRRVYKRVNMNGKQIGLYFSSHGANDGEKNFWDNLIFHRRDVSRCPEISSCLDSNVNQEREQCLAQHACNGYLQIVCRIPETSPKDRHQRSRTRFSRSFQIFLLHLPKNIRQMEFGGCRCARIFGK